ncbi:MAG: murein biosynthesis integral membrane protein MurJ [Acidobacteriota bacterium]|nr:murein biosynthesis integral membrane protein MurJ [Blastocatellia bacterium]MDW8411429.1 murein biosynthesis integral membrane protein MurJ [Acidobacteriota bacterium]
MATTLRGATLVATGIFLSRISGFLRVSVFAHYFGNSAAADAFNAAMRIPNFLQNLFGEGVLSASFIPVYARLDAEGRKEEASRLAYTIFSFLVLLVASLVGAGIVATPLLIGLIAPGFTGERQVLAILLVRIFFPATGLLVLSAWCLGVLNSHRKFFLSYVAPVVWNAAIIAALLLFGHNEQAALAIYVAYAAVIGSLLQFLVQLPSAIKILGRVRLQIVFDTFVNEVLRNFLPVVIGRGIVQISAYFDSLLASLLPAGAVAALGYAQMLYLLPVSLFGMSVSAAELPEMSRTIGSDEQYHQLREKLRVGLERIAFFVIPSATVFLLFGDIVIGVLLESGQFRRADSVYVWATLAGSSVGLLSVTFGRLYASTFYALKDTRSPLRFAIVRVVVSIASGIPLALYLPPKLGLSAAWGVVGITLASSLGGWMECLLLRRSLCRRIGKVNVELKRIMLAAVLAAAPALAIKSLSDFKPMLMVAFVVVPFGIIYLTTARWLAVAVAVELLDKIRRRLLKR